MRLWFLGGRLGSGRQILAACVEMRDMREFKQGVLGEFFHWGSRIYRLALDLKY